MNAGKHTFPANGETSCSSSDTPIPRWTTPPPTRSDRQQTSPLSDAGSLHTRAAQLELWHMLSDNRLGHLHARRRRAPAL